jgi:phenylacetate-coenzyme A ligase PaaK-like adenylate-forming protein
VALPGEGPALRDLILRVMQGAAAQLLEPDFSALALDVFRYQAGENRVYRAYLERRGIDPGSVDDWRDIPPVPAAAFKAAPIVCGRAEDVQAIFRTSGTTSGGERRGVHHVPDLSLYHAALSRSFGEHLLPDTDRIHFLFLVPLAADAPDSSLSHMAARVSAEFGVGAARWLLDPDGIAHGRASIALRDAEELGEPVCLFGTAFAFVHLLDGLAARGEHHELPAGSRAMETGGFKGRAREVPREALYEMIDERLGIDPRWIVNEYGMTELSSQFYDGVAGDAGDAGERLHRPPPWMRAVARDPVTLDALPDGERGILCHYDLANLGSALGVQTEDEGIVEDDGIRLFGRAPGAEPRGCSIAVDALLEAARRGRA